MKRFKCNFGWLQQTQMIIGYEIKVIFSQLSFSLTQPKGITTAVILCHLKSGDPVSHSDTCPAAQNTVTIWFARLWDGASQAFCMYEKTCLFLKHGKEHMVFQGL